ncbi:MAG TPA: bifunctional 4-hydroxy-2-oxoglutarate aldolase/2-dehydro-3-deoxy-phosphogluconate aldolase [Ohtaekwangia sp.]|nr:bifunctional 4-hydroxy-2-oxoglutarate aldolase/2-dehydro-3-deoxy-phosphogluconate aldolase [Ohtaekwangia sp.]
MAKKFTQDQIIRVIEQSGLVPLFTHENHHDAIQVVEAAYFAGIRVFEFTNRRKNSYDVFVKVLDYCQQFPDLILGIGTIMDAETTEKFIDAGAHFIISPILKLEMASVCYEHDVLWIPGCATLTEIVTAKENGAGIIKIFPGSVLGPKFVSAIMPVVPDLKLMITGGVEPTEQNLAAWFKAGAMCVGLGSHLFTREIMNAKDWPGLEDKISSTLALIQEIRGV